jgi:hypothetical protein
MRKRHGDMGLEETTVRADEFAAPCGLGRPAELLAVLPHDRCRRLQPHTDTTALVDNGTLGGLRQSIPSPFCGHRDMHPCKQCNLWC